MSELADIDTSSAGMLAYWNMVDSGGANSDNIDPIPIVDMGIVDQFQDYDNGVEGVLSLPQNGASALTLNYRVKTDGWVVVWDNGVTNYRSGPDSVGHGSAAYNVMAQSPDNLPKTAHSEAIRRLNRNTNYGGNFSHSEVGYYNYALPNATSLRLLHERFNVGEGVSAVSMPTGYEVYQHEFAWYANGSGDGTGFTLAFGGETVDPNGFDQGIAQLPETTISTAESFFTSSCSIDTANTLTTNHVIYMNEVSL